MMQLKISALESVCSQMPSLQESYFLFYLETSVHHHPLVFMPLTAATVRLDQEPQHLGVMNAPAFMELKLFEAF